MAHDGLCEPINLFDGIFEMLPALVLELAGVTIPTPARYGIRAEEIKQIAFRFDELSNSWRDTGDQKQKARWNRALEENGV